MKRENLIKRQKRTIIFIEIQKERGNKYEF